MPGLTGDLTLNQTIPYLVVFWPVEMLHWSTNGYLCMWLKLGSKTVRGTHCRLWICTDALRMYERTCFPTKEVSSVIWAPSAKVYQLSTAVEATPEPMMIPSICLSFKIATIVRLMCALINELSKLDSTYVHAIWTCNLILILILSLNLELNLINIFDVNWTTVPYATYWHCHIYPCWHWNLLNLYGIIQQKWVKFPHVKALPVQSTHPIRQRAKVKWVSVMGMAQGGTLLRIAGRSHSSTWWSLTMLNTKGIGAEV